MGIARLKAFTIIELLVVLVLSALVFALASMGWLYFQQLSNKINDDQSVLQSFNKLDYLLKTDISKATTITAQEDEIIMICKDQPVGYLFGDTTIIRTQAAVSDTFFCRYTKQWYTVENSQSLLCKMDFVFDLYTNSISKSYVKHYDQKTLVQQTNR